MAKLRESTVCSVYFISTLRAVPSATPPHDDGNYRNRSNSCKPMDKLLQLFTAVNAISMKKYDGHDVENSRTVSGRFIANSSGMLK